MRRRKKMGKLDLQREWDKKNTVSVNFRLMKKGDADVIAWWNAQPRKAEAFRRLVRQQIQAEEAMRWLQENPEKK